MDTSRILKALSTPKFNIELIEVNHSYIIKYFNNKHPGINYSEVIKDFNIASALFDMKLEELESN